ncbi:hypothetical protein F5Y15DRAFT_78636 [Xylariaceae sp. FL0016]|nr:hypothetical protein F5Y15DRAFT_78636 [Xylariaceae sp. FL0016]
MRGASNDHDHPTVLTGDDADVENTDTDTAGHELGSDTETSNVKRGRSLLARRHETPATSLSSSSSRLPSPAHSLAVDSGYEGDADSNDEDVVCLANGISSLRCRQSEHLLPRHHSNLSNLNPSHIVYDGESSHVPQVHVTSPDGVTYAPSVPDDAVGWDSDSSAIFLDGHADEVTGHAHNEGDEVRILLTQKLSWPWALPSIDSVPELEADDVHNTKRRKISSEVDARLLQHSKRRIHGSTPCYRRYNQLLKRELPRPPCDRLHVPHVKHGRH